MTIRSVAMIGLGGGLFAVGTLTHAMGLDDSGLNGLAIGAWGAVQATAAGVAIAMGGALRDVVTGLATDFCVAWTALDARKAGFAVYVVEDATRGIDLNGSVAAAWKQMAAKGVKRIQSGDLEVA